jgi:hypothetical protein
MFEVLSHIIVAGECNIWRELLECGGKYLFIGHYVGGDRRFPTFLPWFDTDAVNSMVVRGNASSIIERIRREILDCL